MLFTLLTVFTSAMPCVGLAVQARAFTHAGDSVDREDTFFGDRKILGVE